MNLPSWLLPFWGRIVQKRLIVTLVALLVALLGTIWLSGWDWLWIVSSFGCWLRQTPTGPESRSTTLRNIGLLVGGGIAILVAYRRSVIAQRGITNERYQRSAEMLGSPVLAVRLGGMYVLRRVADEEPGPFHLQIMRVLCAFVRNPTPAKDEKETDGKPTVKTIREDVQVALWIIAFRSKAGIELEKKEGVELDLCGADLSNAQLALGNLTHWVLDNADLTNTVLYKAKGLTQHELDFARAHPARPPNLKGARDAETGKRLKWTKGKPNG